MLDPNGFNELKLCRSGPMLFNKNDWPIGASLRKYGEFSWGEMMVFEKLVKPGELVLDAGANIGTHTVGFSKLVGPSGCVLAFEPQRISFQTLCANLALNHCTNVHALHAALGRADGEIKVPVREQYARNNFGGVQLAGVTEGETVDLITIDRLQLRACSFIKADVEGMEADVLAGAEKTIARHRPVLYFEADGAQARQMIARLLGERYECYWSLPPLFNPRNFAGDEENIFLNNGSEICSINLLGIPAERNITVTDLYRIDSPDEDPIKVEFDKRRKAREESLV